MTFSLSRLRRWRSKLLQRVFNKTMGQLPRYRRWSEDIHVIDHCSDVIRDHLVAQRQKLMEQGVTEPVLLDVGGREGEKKEYAEGYIYRGMDVNPQSSEIIKGDICHCPDIPDHSFDVVMSFDVFEHVERPWDAAAECVRLLKPGGLMVHRTLFSYRYHPCPIDYWRFSSQGLEYLFQRTGEMETLLTGYDLSIRRHDKRALREDERDQPPLDYLGGFRENWRVLYIGRKKSS